jgi:hypothetical protein
MRGMLDFGGLRPVAYIAGALGNNTVRPLNVHHTPPCKVPLECALGFFLDLGPGSYSWAKPVGLQSIQPAASRHLSVGMEQDDVAAFVR